MVPRGAGRKVTTAVPVFVRRELAKRQVLAVNYDRIDERFGRSHAGSSCRGIAPTPLHLTSTEARRYALLSKS